MWSAAERQPVFTLIVLCALLYLPGFFQIPPVDRDEARFAQATRQMVETGDFVNIRFQDEARNKKPIGIHWLQALPASLFAKHNPDRIWAYRLPSLLGATAAVLLTFWAGIPLFGRRAAFLGAGILAASLLLGVEARLAKTDAVLLATIIACQGVLARLHVAPARAADLRLTLLFWVALAIGILVKGPIAPLVLGLTLLVLCVWDRKATLLWSLRPVLGIPLLLVLVLPWAVAIAIETRGTFFTQALGGDLLPKLAGGQESHGAPPGYYVVAAVLTFFPSTPFFLPAIVYGVQERRAAAIRFIIAWAVPLWLFFELIPTKLPHYVLPAYPALALLMGALLSDSGARAQGLLRGWVFWFALLLFAVTVLALAGASVAIQPLLEGHYSPVDIGLAGILCLAGAAALWCGVRRRYIGLWFGAIATSLLVQISAFGMIAPSLHTLWISDRIVVAVPRMANGKLPPLVVSGFSEPSLVFRAGTGTWLGPPNETAHILAKDKRAIAVIEQSYDSAFQQEAVDEHIAVQSIGTVSGLNYSTGRRIRLTLYARKDGGP